MKIVKALAILLVGPLLGVLVGFFLGSLAPPPDPNLVSNGGHAAPGDGFLIMGYMFVSLLVSVPLSNLLAGIVLFRKPRPQNKIGATHRHKSGTHIAAQGVSESGPFSRHTASDPSLL
jgi:hypothetical protein